MFVLLEPEELLHRRLAVRDVQARRLVVLVRVRGRRVLAEGKQALGRRALFADVERPHGIEGVELVVQVSPRSSVASKVHWSAKARLSKELRSLSPSTTIAMVPLRASSMSTRKMESPARARGKLGLLPAVALVSPVASKKNVLNWESGKELRVLRTLERRRQRRLGPGVGVEWREAIHRGVVDGDPLYRPGAPRRVQPQLVHRQGVARRRCRPSRGH